MIDDVVWSKLVSASIESIPKLLSGAIDETKKWLETEKKLNELITAPLTAGKGFLKRAEKEPENREHLIEQAQDKFTEMVAFDGHPYLQSRALYFVGFCHKLLGNTQLSKQYFFDACLKVMEAVEEAERRVHGRARFINLLGYADTNGLIESEKEGIYYNMKEVDPQIPAIFYYPIKDDYMKSLDKIIGREMPICCVWIEAIGTEDIKKNNLIDAGNSTFFLTVFSEESPYFKEKKRYINSVRSNL